MACAVIAGFAAETASLNTPALADGPLLLADYAAKRPRVAACSAEAAALGIEPGMALSRARGLCPTAHVAPFDAAEHQAALDRLVALLWTFSNRVEVDSSLFPQTAACYIDLGTLNEGDLCHLIEAMHGAIARQFGLSAHVGAAHGKLTARLAALAPGVHLVPHGAERAFIAPFAIDFLPLAAEMRRRLSLLGLGTIGQFAGLTPSAALAQFGKSGQAAHRLAQGLDGRPVVPKKMPPAETARHQEEEPITSGLRLELTASVLAATLAARLDGRGAAAHEVALLLTLADGRHQRECLHLLEPTFGEAALERVLRRLLARFSLNAGVVALEVQVTHLVSSLPRQLELFTGKPPRQRLLDLTAALAERHREVAFLEAHTAETSALDVERRFTLRRISAS